MAKLTLEDLAKAAGMISHLNLGAASHVSSEGCNGVTQEHLENFAMLIAKHCAQICRREAAERRDGALTFPTEQNPAYLRGGVTGATQCALCIEGAFGIGVISRAPGG